MKIFVKGLNFSLLPLAGLVVNTKNLSKNQLENLNDGLIKSIDFIRQNINSQLQPTGELRDIMQKNGFNPNSHLSAYQKLSEIDPESLSIILSYAKLYQVEGFDNIDLSKLDSFFAY